MARTLTYFVFIILAIGLIAGFLTTKSAGKYRNLLAYKLVEAGQNRLAEPLYAISASAGDTLAANNLAVLQYHRLRYKSDCKCDNWSEAKKQFVPLFEDLARKNSSVAAYNRGLLDFRCSSKKRCYKTGKDFFQMALDGGDPLALGAYAIHLTTNSKHADFKIRQAKLVEAANAGSSDAAFILASHLKTKNPSQALAYAEFAASGGNSHAQELRGKFFENPDFYNWLELAAENPTNPRASAAQLLAYLHREGERGIAQDFEKSRKWYQKAMRLNAKHKHAIVVRPDGFRWRDTDTAYVKNSSAPYLAAYELAILDYYGIGGPQDMKAFERRMKFAAQDKVHDSRLILMQLEQKRNPISQDRFDAKQSQWVYERLGRHKKYLVPYIRDLVDQRKIRFVSFLELAEWRDKGSLTAPVGRNSFDPYARFKEKPYFFTYHETFLATAPLNLPGNMYGQYASNFILPPAIPIPRTMSGNTIIKLKN